MDSSYIKGCSNTPLYKLKKLETVTPARMDPLKKVDICHSPRQSLLQKLCFLFQVRYKIQVPQPVPCLRATHFPVKCSTVVPCTLATVSTAALPQANNNDSSSLVLKSWTTFRPLIHWEEIFYKKVLSSHLYSLVILQEYAKLSIKYTLQENIRPGFRLQNLSHLLTRLCLIFAAKIPKYRTLGLPPVNLSSVIIWNPGRVTRMHS